MNAAETVLEIEQIKQLKARYFRLMDTKRWDEWGDLFTADMRFWNDNESDPENRPPITSSGKAFASMVSRLLANAVTVHQGHMPEIELTSDRTANGVWAMYDWVDAPDRDIHFEGWGHYTEKYEKGDDGRWRIKDMHLTRLRTIE